MISELAECLSSAGHRVTPARQAVLQAVAAAESGEHLSPVQILRRGRMTYPALSRATVYRTLDLLTSLGVLRPIYLGEGDRLYIRADEGHHHLVCSGCRTVIGFEDCAVAELEDKLAATLGFEIQGHLLEFYGLCSECSRRAGEDHPSADDRPGSEMVRRGCYAHR